MKPIKEELSAEVLSQSDPTGALQHEEDPEAGPGLLLLTSRPLTEACSCVGFFFWGCGGGEVYDLSGQVASVSAENSLEKGATAST